MPKLLFSRSWSLRPQSGRLTVRKRSIVANLAVLARIPILTLPPEFVRHTIAVPPILVGATENGHEDGASLSRSL
jgi:hypothetical protein